MGIKIIIDTSFDVSTPEALSGRSCIGACIIESVILPKISQVDRSRNESVDVILVVLSLCKYAILKNETVIVTVNDITNTKMLVLLFISGQGIIGDADLTTAWVYIIFTAKQIYDFVSMLILVIPGINTREPVYATKSLA